MLQAGVPFTAVDIFRTPLTTQQIQTLLKMPRGNLPASELFSWKSPQARARGLTPGSQSEETLVALMAAEPRLIRRPLVAIGDELVIGADLERLRALTGSRAANGPSTER